MPQSIAVVDGHSGERRKLCAVLESAHYQTTPFQSLDRLVKAIRKSLFHSVILDLDRLPVDNSFFKELRALHPSICVIGISCRTFHPELEESIRSHISVCLSKPVKIEELIFWLRSVGEKDAGGLS